MMKTTTITFTALLILLSAGHSIAHTDTLRTVALSGNVAPGTDGGVDFLKFSGPLLNDAGQTAFRVDLTGAGVVVGSNDVGIWSEGGDAGLTLVARERNVAPGSGGVTFSRFGLPVLNGAGQLAFLGNLAGMGTGVWSEGGGTGLALVARMGDEAPGTGTGVVFSRSSFSSFPSGNRPVLNDEGQTAFLGTLTGTGVTSSNNTGIWSEGGGAGLALVAREGDAAPDTSNGVTFSAGFVTPVLNNAGQTAFQGFLTGTGISGSNNRGIWSGGGGSGLALVARRGDVAPGTGGVSFSGSFSRPVLNDAGQTAFRGSLTGTGVVSGSNNTGIWSEGGGTGVALVARAGDAAPDTSSGVNFSVGFSTPALNDAGQTAFRGVLTGTGVLRGSNNIGIWSEGRGTGVALVARAGDAAPGTSGGVNFSGFNGPVLNDAGQTAFVGFLAGTGVSRSNRAGIWAEDPSGVLKLIIREGELLDIDDGPSSILRTISSLGFFGDTGNGFGRPSGFNNLGQLAFTAWFTDGSSGIFVSNLVAIPEPSTASLLVAASTLFFAMRHRYQFVA